MAVDYNKYLTDEQKASILNQRLQQFASEAYQHEINKKVALENNDTEGADKSDQAVAVINQAIATHEQELESLNIRPTESTEE